MRYVYRATIKEAGQKAFPQVKVRSLRALPIRSINFNDDTERQAHDTIVALVGKMLTLHIHLDAVKTPYDREVVARRIELLDEETGRLIEELYGLSDQETAQIQEHLQSLSL